MQTSPLQSPQYGILVFLNTFTFLHTVHLVHFWGTFSSSCLHWQNRKPWSTKTYHCTQAHRCAQIHTFVMAKPVSSGSPLSRSRPWATHSFLRPPPLNFPPTCQSRQENVNTAHYVLCREGCTHIASGCLHLVLSGKLFWKKQNSNNSLSPLLAKSCTVITVGFTLPLATVNMLSSVGLTRELIWYNTNLVL